MNNTMILRQNEHKQILWKNGCGITHLIDRQPNNDQEQFHWRLSMASVKYPGAPFSIYPNIDRTLVIIDGQHLTLKLNNDNDQLVHLNQNSPPYSFPGETPIECQIYEDTLIDLNIMTKRDLFRHTVQRIILNKDQNPINITNQNEKILFVVVAKGVLQINEITLTKGDVLKIIDNQQLIQISTSIDNTIIYIIILTSIQ